MKRKIIDIDAAVKDFAPVEVKFRGKRYALGRTVESFFAFQEAATAVERLDGESDAQFAIRRLRPALKALDAGLASELESQDLGAAEELAFMRVVQEVVDRFGGLSFREEDS